MMPILINYNPYTLALFDSVWNGPGSNPNRVYITSKKLLFLGLNWYNDDSYDGFAVKKPNEKVNDMGWDMRPIRIEETLVRLYNRYQLPILITENGLADGDDSDSEWWLSETLQALEHAEAAGVDLMEYLHWPAFDNFEWDKGYWPRFGLIAVEIGRTSCRERV